ncbi:hypothetical protein HK102_011177, partial [Quaeritorhiza haematococci]
MRQPEVLVGPTPQPLDTAANGFLNNRDYIPKSAGITTYSPPSHSPQTVPALSDLPHPPTFTPLLKRLNWLPGDLDHSITIYLHNKFTPLTPTHLSTPLTTPPISSCTISIYPVKYLFPTSTLAAVPIQNPSGATLTIGDLIEQMNEFLNREP